MKLLHYGFFNIILTVNSNLSISERLPKALLNTMLGMGIVVSVLIFISILISFMKFIPDLVDMFSNGNKSKKVLPKSTDTDKSSKDTQKSELVIDKDYTNNGELVAVITAAIMASMGDEAPVDGLVVRSIKRAKNNRWQKAL